ncbi:MAG TPA: hypothetical protein RMG45_33080, partial [Polyangiaceae bacterium LLY-WYZ-15_(1-7)]|nr:hypothetical protein [Polyangiaceae bacterium LLY-WYZ-15_(1-7)]HJL50747.1 hypothetical protein [Polyangiaceae bacterium LLY-WYZ-15_(1-7)]
MSPSPPRVLLDERRRRGILDELDARIDALGPRRSLAADRDRATSLLALYQREAEGLPETARVAFALGLHRAAEAQLEAFPGNLFWDFDALAAATAAAAREGDAERAAAEVTARTALIASLQQLFGRRTAIHFRYVHDFMYGFDWAKWVRREPEARRAVGPFEPAFLEYMWRRGHELLALIANDDEKYPKLATGHPRNPFGFSREPEEEERLFRDLAARDLIPVRAWERHPAPVWDRPYQEARAERAAA